jgi:hypothetical protein
VLGRKELSSRADRKEIRYRDCLPQGTVYHGDCLPEVERRNRLPEVDGKEIGEERLSSRCRNKGGLDTEDRLPEADRSGLGQKGRSSTGRQEGIGHDGLSPRGKQEENRTQGTVFHRKTGGE